MVSFDDVLALGSPVIFAQGAPAFGSGSPLLDALLQTAVSLWDLLLALLGAVVPWSPLIAWIAYWLLAVNWVRLRETLAKGGWVGIVLLAAAAVMVWGHVSPTDPVDFFGLKVSNFVEKLVYVSGLICLMFLAGAVQLSGSLAGCCGFQEPILIADDQGHDSGHGQDGHH